MKHPEIDEQAVAEQYVVGRLTPAEIVAFEEHFLDCAQCIQAVEDAERLHRGLQMVAAEDVASRQALLTAAWRALRSRGGSALLMLVLTIGLLPGVFIWHQTAGLRDDLQATRAELAAERLPRANTPILTLVPTRSQEQPLQQISLGAEPEWLVLAVEIEDSAPSVYGAELIADDGTILWESTNLRPSFQGTLTVSLHTSLLPASLYTLVLTTDGHRIKFPLRFVND